MAIQQWSLLPLCAPPLAAGQGAGSACVIATSNFRVCNGAGVTPISSSPILAEGCRQALAGAARYPRPSGPPCRRMNAQQASFACPAQDLRVGLEATTRGPGPPASSAELYLVSRHFTGTWQLVSLTLCPCLGVVTSQGRSVSVWGLHCSTRTLGGSHGATGHLTATLSL